MYRYILIQDDPFIQSYSQAFLVSSGSEVEQAKGLFQTICPADPYNSTYPLPNHPFSVSPRSWNLTAQIYTILKEVRL